MGVMVNTVKWKAPRVTWETFSGLSVWGFLGWVPRGEIGQPRDTVGSSLESVECVDIVGWSLVLKGRGRAVASWCDQLPPAPATLTFSLSRSVPSLWSQNKSFLPWVALVRSFTSSNQKVTTWRSSCGGLRGRLKDGVMSKKRLGALFHSAPLTHPAWLRVVVQRNNL